MQRSRKILTTIKRKMSQKKIDLEITTIIEPADNDYTAITINKLMNYKEMMKNGKETKAIKK